MADEKVPLSWYAILKGNIQPYLDVFELMTDPRLEPLDVNGQKFGKLTYFAFDDYVDYEGEAVIMSRRIIKGWVAELAGLQVLPKTGRIFLELTTTW